jgi:hypothetical protein
MTKKSQLQKFRDKARELETDESEDRFSATLRAIGRHKAKRLAAKAPNRKKR